MRIHQLTAVRTSRNPLELCWRRGPGSNRRIKVLQTLGLQPQALRNQHETPRLARAVRFWSGPRYRPMISLTYEPSKPDAGPRPHATPRPHGRKRIEELWLDHASREMSSKFCGSG